jgi:hypothetical protein
MPPAVWLFVRGAQSLRVERPAGILALLVKGPAAARRWYAFDRESELLEFQRTFERGLRGDGWLPEGAPPPETKTPRPRQKSAMLSGEEGRA